MSRSAISWWPYTCDDTYITCRYAHNLSAGCGPVFNIGEHVEGYSSPFLVFVLALVSRAGGDPVVASKGLGFLSALALPVLCFLVVSRCSGNLLLAGIAAIWLASVPELHIYMCSGMETVPFALTVAVTLFLISLRSSRVILQVGTMLSILIVACFRPEGLLLGPALFVVAMFLCRHRRCRMVLMLFVVFMAALLAMRWSYYRALLPNTYLAKPSTILSVLSRTGIADAWWFISRSILVDTSGPTGVVRALGGLVLAPVMFLGLARFKSLPLSAACAASVIVGLVYLAYCPQDWMPGERFLFPFLFPSLILCAVGVSRIWKQKGNRYSWPVLILSICAAGLWVGSNYISIGDQQERYRSELANAALHSPQYAEIGKWLKTHASPTDRVLAYEVGAVGYYSQLRVIDHEGLIDRYIAKQVKIAGGYRWVRRGMNPEVMWNIVRYCIGRQPVWYLARSRIGPGLRVGEPVTPDVCKEPIQNAFLQELGPSMVLARIFPMGPSGEDYYLLLRRSPSPSQR